MGSRNFSAVVGLDPSLTGTGLAVVYPPSNPPERVALHLIATKAADWQHGPRNAKGQPTQTWLDRARRARYIANQMDDLVPARSLVFMEAPSYGSAGSGTWDRAGLWWELYRTLDAIACTVVPVSPTQRMQYATGTGRAGKDQVLAAVVKRYHWLDVTDNNVADALVFAAMAARINGTPIDVASGITEKHMKALDKITLEGH